jgi:hypothetical protein
VELHVYSSPNGIRIIKSKRMRRAGHVVRTRFEKYKVFFFSEKLKEKDHFEDRGVDGRIILKSILGIVWEGLYWVHVT